VDFFAFEAGNYGASLLTIAGLPHFQLWPRPAKIAGKTRTVLVKGFSQLALVASIKRQF